MGVPSAPEWSNDLHLDGRLTCFQSSVKGHLRLTAALLRVHWVVVASSSHQLVGTAHTRYNHISSRWSCRWEAEAQDAARRLTCRHERSRNRFCNVLWLQIAHTVSFFRNNTYEVYP